MKKNAFWLFLLAIQSFGAPDADAQQRKFFAVTGAVEKKMTLTADSLERFPMRKIDSVVILNHLGQRKSTLKNLEVVRLRDVLSRSVIPVESPKQLNEFYFVCIASDGYKAVFSWNELFNNPLGDSIFIIVRRDGKVSGELPEGIAVISPTDTMNGRRYIKNLEKISVRRAE